MTLPNVLELHFCQWVLQVAMSDMRVSEKLVTIVAPLLQTGDVRALMNACNLSERAVKAAKARPVEDGWLRIKVHGGGTNKDGRAVGGRGQGNVYSPSLPGVSIPILITGLEQVQLKTVVTAINQAGHTTEARIAAETVPEKGAPDSTLSASKGAQRDTLSVQIGARGVTLSTSKGAADDTHLLEKSAQASTLPGDMEKEIPPPTPPSKEKTNLNIWSEFGEKPEFGLTPPESEIGKAPKSKRHSYPEAFEAFWSSYPDKTNNSKPKALEEWKRLSAEDQAVATGSLTAFAKFLREKPDHPCVHAERYLKWRRFESFAPQEAKPWWRGRALADLKALPEEFWRPRIEAKANGVWDASEICLPPGHPQCPLPERLIAELGLMEKYGPKQSRKWRGVQ